MNIDREGFISAEFLIRRDSNTSPTNDEISEDSIAEFNKANTPRYLRQRHNHLAPNDNEQGRQTHHLGRVGVKRAIVDYQGTLKDY